MNRTLQIVLAVVVVIIVAGGSFYGGVLYGQGQSQTARSGANRFNNNPNGGYFQVGPGGQGFQGQRGQGGGAVFGQVSEVGAGYLVVDNNGTQTKVTVTDTTLMEKNVSVKLTDFAVGDTVIVSGTAATDGTITARSVQSSPMGRFGGQGAPGGQNPGGQNLGAPNQGGQNQ